MKYARAATGFTIAYFACLYAGIIMQVPDPAVYCLVFILPFVIMYMVYAVLEQGEPLRKPAEQTSSEQNRYSPADSENKVMNVSEAA